MVSPKFQPARYAATLASAICGFFANFLRRKDSVPSVGRWYIHDSRPSANMFFERSASLRESPNSLSASIVSVVSGTGWTLYASSEPSSSGLVS